MYKRREARKAQDTLQRIKSLVLFGLCIRMRIGQIELVEGERHFVCSFMLLLYYYFIAHNVVNDPCLKIRTLDGPQTFIFVALETNSQTRIITKIFITSISIFK